MSIVTEIKEQRNEPNSQKQSTESSVLDRVWKGPKYKCLKIKNTIYEALF